MSIFSASNEIGKIFYGSNEIGKVYYGSTLIWELEDLVTLTVSPTLSGATVTFNTTGIVSGKTIKVPKGTTVSYTLKESSHYDATNSVKVDSNMTVTPKMRLKLTSPTINYGPGTCYNVTSWVSKGTAIQAGTYNYTRSGNTVRWTVATNTRGEITSYSVSGSGVSTRTSGQTILTPTGGWTEKEVWE